MIESILWTKIVSANEIRSNEGSQCQEEGVG